MFAAVVYDYSWHYYAVMATGPLVGAGVALFATRNRNRLAHEETASKLALLSDTARRELVRQINTELRNLYAFDSVMEDALIRVLVAAAANGYDGFKQQAALVVDRGHIRPAPPLVTTDD